MYEKRIECSECGKKYRLNDIIFRCKACFGSLDMVYDYSSLKSELSPRVFSSRPFNHARYAELYPVKQLLSLQEGGTPIVRGRNIERKQKLRFELWFKCESQNPTGSFKDRGSSVEVSKALEIIKRRSNPFKGVACASTGNMGASVAAYSALSGLKCTILTPKDAARTKVEQILAYGAKVYMIRGDYTKAAKMVEEAYKKHNIYLLGDYLYRREGTKSVGFEIADQMGLLDTENAYMRIARAIRRQQQVSGFCDYVFCPIGNGTLISATWKAFRELKKIGMIRELPRMAGVQARGCNPVKKAFDRSHKIKNSWVRPMKGRTIATAIECGAPLDGMRALAAVKESNGFVNDVTDSQMLGARDMLAKEEGIFAEPAGAVSLAGLLKAKRDIPKSSVVVCVVTGHGLKAPKTRVKGRARKISASYRSLGKIF